MKKKNGFTLIELIVVIAIIGVLLALIFPILGHHKHNTRAVIKLDNGESITVEVDYWIETDKGLIKIKAEDGSIYYSSPNNVVIYTE